MKRGMKRTAALAGRVLGIVLAVFVVLLIVLTVTEHTPEPEEELAYDDGEGKLAQTKMLSDLLQKEVEKGNYVIAAGDFNQSFSNVDTGAYSDHNPVLMTITLE